MGEHATSDEALETWPTEIARLREVGRANKAGKVQDKLDALKDLTAKDRS